MIEEFEKQGYLYDDFRMFHIMDHCEREQAFHYHDFYKILIFISGNVSYNIEGKSYKLSPYDIVLVSKGDIHKPEYVAGEPYERVIFFISEEYLERHKGEDFNLANCFEEAKKSGSDVLRFPAMVNTMLMEQVGKLEKNGAENRYAGKLYANALFMELLVLLNRACLEEADCFSRNVHYNQKMIDIIRYINEHLNEELAIDSLSERFYISKYHMMRQFKEETGYTIHNYITEKRVQMATQLIQSGMSATKACFECGFKDYSTFSRAYKKRMDRSPSEGGGL